MKYQSATHQGLDLRWRLRLPGNSPARRWLAAIWAWM